MKKPIKNLSINLTCLASVLTSLTAVLIFSTNASANPNCRRYVDSASQSLQQSIIARKLYLELERSMGTYPTAEGHSSDDLQKSMQFGISVMASCRQEAENGNLPELIQGAYVLIELDRRDVYQWLRDAQRETMYFVPNFLD